MNWKIAMIFQENIPTTPITPIDDAFIGIALSRGGIDDKHFTKVLEFHSWGFPENAREVFDICAINGIVYFHKYLPKALNCFWETFATHRKMCSKDRLSPEEQQINNVALLCKVIVPIVVKMAYPGYAKILKFSRNYGKN